MTDAELMSWAEACTRMAGEPGPTILRVLAENAALRKQVEGHCERIAHQSELLSRKAEKDT